MANALPELCGEIDHATAEAFRSGLYQVIDGADAPIVPIDLAAVTFIDSAGYHALVAADQYAIRNDHIMVIANLSKQCAKLVRLCDRANQLYLEDGIPTPTAALAHASRFTSER